MVIVTVKSTPKTAFKDEFLDAFKDIAVIVREEKGCLEYEIYQKDPEGTELFIFERWESREALDAHLATKHMSTFFEKTETWFDSEKKLIIYEVQQ